MINDSEMNVDRLANFDEIIEDIAATLKEADIPISQNIQEIPTDVDELYEKLIETDIPEQKMKRNQEKMEVNQTEKTTENDDDNVKIDIIKTTLETNKKTQRKELVDN